MFMQDVTAFSPARKVNASTLIDRAARPLSGLVAGTLVEAAEGWRRVEHLGQGDAVYTHDGGLSEVRLVTRRTVAPRQVIFVPGGALGNCADMRLLPGQHVMIEHEAGLRAFGTPYLLVPAASLVACNGVRWQRAPEEVDVITLGFDDEEVVWANSGLRLYCPYAGGAQEGSRFFTMLGLDQALALMALVEREEIGGADLRAA